MTNFGNVQGMERTWGLRAKRRVVRMLMQAALLLVVAACSAQTPNGGSGDLAIDSVAPSAGSAFDLVTVRGENIAGDATVLVCGEPATNVVVRNSAGVPIGGGSKAGVSVEFNPPAQAATGTCDVVVEQGSEADAESATLSQAFTYDTELEAIRINAGGPTVTNSMGTWSEDVHFVGGGTFASAGAEISGTDDDEIYQTERDGFVDGSHGSFAYAIPVDDGEYTVRLHFAELFIGTDAPAAAGTGVGDRVFSYAAEGTELESAFDVYLEGGEEPYVAVVQEHTQITVDDGVLDLDFIVGASNSPLVSAIEVLPSALD